MWSWKTDGTPFLALIIPEHAGHLMNSLAGKMLALTILRNFAAGKVLVSPVEELTRRSQLRWGAVFFFEENVNGKHRLLREHCVMGPTNDCGPCGPSLTPCGSLLVQNIVVVLLDSKGFLALAVTILCGPGFINCGVRLHAPDEII
jgi:hypothetical protein